jgi:hypothetical protein
LPGNPKCTSSYDSAFLKHYNIVQKWNNIRYEYKEAPMERPHYNTKLGNRIAYEMHQVRQVEKLIFPKYIFSHFIKKKGKHKTFFLIL